MAEPTTRVTALNMCSDDRVHDARSRRSRRRNERSRARPTCSRWGDFRFPHEPSGWCPSPRGGPFSQATKRPVRLQHGGGGVSQAAEELCAGGFDSSEVFFPVAQHAIEHVENCTNPRFTLVGKVDDDLSRDRRTTIRGARSRHQHRANGEGHSRRTKEPKTARIAGTYYVAGARTTAAQRHGEQADRSARGRAGP